jgi:hypothetical protein
MRSERFMMTAPWMSSERNATHAADLCEWGIADDRQARAWNGSQASSVQATAFKRQAQRTDRYRPGNASCHSRWARLGLMDETLLERERR